ncbi:hypothetical protein J2S19_004992 [Metabacillus malikii]|uniref:Uncharacterized protein n=1 Tax=Metabacillus malikii TaxID=1504265 RepID=A0ABT9ZMX7_9BACI|nr:hypothetical protein [Metabacillus malikii]
MGEVRREQAFTLSSSKSVGLPIDVQTRGDLKFVNR